MFKAKSYEDAIRNPILIGGGSDTVTAITGRLAEALFGVLGSILAVRRSKLTPGMLKLMDQLYDQSTNKSSA